MKESLHAFVTKRRERWRVYVLLMLLAAAGGMLMGEGGTNPAAYTATQAGKPLAGMTVALDPGHGGYDGGARAHDSGLWEKEITLRIALEIEKALVEQGAEVVLTRREDVCLADGDTATRARKREDLRKRREIAEKAGADVLLSIHMNEYRSRRESGPQVFYQRGADGGRMLAGALQQAMLEELDPPKRRVAMAGDYYVLRGRLPSALVECGFLSNASEEKLLLTPAYQRRIALAVARGLAEYQELARRVEDGD